MSTEEKRFRPHEALEAALVSDDPIDLSWIDPMPSDDGWTLAPDALRFIGRLLPRLAPAHIVEFGSGLSTRFLARLGAALKEAPWITSIDHDPEFGAGGLPDYPRLSYQLAPLVARDFGGKLLPSYYFVREKFASTGPPDLVIIDGPPNCLGGREGVLYQTMEWAKAGTVVLIDDANRREEQSAMACWRDVLGDAIEIRHLPGFAKGMSAVIVREPVSISTLWDRRLDGARADICSFVAPGTAVALIDDNCFGREFLASHQILPFLEREGEYWGAPLNSAEAIAELSRLRRNGIQAIALLWTSSWWRDYYGEFISHLDANHRCFVNNDRIVIFDLQGPNRSV